MITPPPRPRQFRDKWIMTYWNFDRGRTPPIDLSEPLPFDNQGDARQAALTAKKTYENDEIRVFFAVVYPPTSETNVQPFVVNFQ